MKLWKISQDVNTDYDTYDSIIVCAETEEEAKRIHPRQEINSDWHVYYDDDKKQFWNKRADGSIYCLEEEHYGSWCCDLSKLKIECIGETDIKTKGVILASFNAG